MYSGGINGHSSIPPVPLFAGGRGGSGTPPKMGHCQTHLLIVTAHSSSSDHVNHHLVISLVVIHAAAPISMIVRFECLKSPPRLPHPQSLPDPRISRPQFARLIEFDYTLVTGPSPPATSCLEWARPLSPHLMWWSPRQLGGARRCSRRLALIPKAVPPAQTKLTRFRNPRWARSPQRRPFRSDQLYKLRFCGLTVAR